MLIKARTAEEVTSETLDIIASHAGAVERSAIAALVELLFIPSIALEAGAERVLGKPYGRNIIVKRGQTRGISLVQMLPGRSTSLHYHRRRREVFVVRHGVLTFFHGNACTVLRSYGVAHSTPEEQHRLANEAAVPLEFIELFVPGDLDDKVRVDDRYGRQLGAVSHRE